MMMSDSQFTQSYLAKTYGFTPEQIRDAWTAFALRLGIGSVFFIGGWYKLSRLLDPAAQEGLVGKYMGSNGYINQFFHDYLFASDSFLTPWLFLTSLSAFELISGILLIAGLLVRPLALIYAFLVWTFVIALPVVTTPGVAAENTHVSPAILVQIRDITLSGLLFMLFNLGAGWKSVDEKLFGKDVLISLAKWEHMGLLLRLSLAVMLLVGGFFAGIKNIKTFDIPGLLLIATGIAMLVDERAARVAGLALVGMMLFYMIGKLSLEKSLILNLNSIKRELAFFAGGIVLAMRGAGDLYTAIPLYRRIACSISHAMPKSKQGASADNPATNN